MLVINLETNTDFDLLVRDDHKTSSDRFILIYVS